MPLHAAEWGGKWDLQPFVSVNRCRSSLLFYLCKFNQHAPFVSSLTHLKYESTFLIYLLRRCHGEIRFSPKKLSRRDGFKNSDTKQHVFSRRLNKSDEYFSVLRVEFSIKCSCICLPLPSASVPGDTSEAIMHSTWVILLLNNREAVCVIHLF